MSNNGQPILQPLQHCIGLSSVDTGRLPKHFTEDLSRPSLPDLHAYYKKDHPDHPACVPDPFVASEPASTNDPTGSIPEILKMIGEHDQSLRTMQALILGLKCGATGVEPALLEQLHRNITQAKYLTQKVLGDASSANLRS